MCVSTTDSCTTDHNPHLSHCPPPRWQRVRRGMPNSRRSGGRRKVGHAIRHTPPCLAAASSPLTFVTPPRRQLQAKKARKRGHGGGGGGRGYGRGDREREDHGANHGRKRRGGCRRDGRGDNPSGMRSIMMMVMASAGDGAKKKGAMGGVPTTQAAIVPVRVPVCTPSCQNCCATPTLTPAFGPPPPLPPLRHCRRRCFEQA